MFLEIQSFWEEIWTSSGKKSKQKSVRNKKKHQGEIQTKYVKKLKLLKGGKAELFWYFSDNLKFGVDFIQRY